MSYTVSANWRLKFKPFEFKKNGVYVSFCGLKDHLVAKARCGDIKSGYSIGAYIIIVMDHAMVLHYQGLDKALIMWTRPEMTVSFMPTDRLFGRIFVI